MPDGVPVVFSAHGVPKSVPAEAEGRGLDYLDATCPLVSKVHRQAERQIEAGRHIVFIGHKGHPEVIGTFGQVPEGGMTLVETLADVAALAFPRRCDARLPHPDDAVGRRHRRDRRGAEGALSRDRRAQGGGHLLRHLQPPGGGQGDRAAVRPGAGDRRAQLVELAAAGRSGRALRHRRAADPARQRDRSGLARGRRHASASPPAPRRPKRWCARSSTRSADWRAVEEDTLVTAEEKMIFKLPRQLVD